MQKLGPNQIKWIEALESGNYAQGKRFLNINNEFCCLGVACEIFGAKKVGESKAQNYESSKGDVIFLTQCGAPIIVVESLALASDLGCPTNESSSKMSLTSMNDLGKSFKEIANTLRANPSAYFKEEK